NKINEMGKISFLPIVFLLMISCKTQELYLNVIEPAPVTLPPEAKSAGIADRSEASKEAGVLDAIDKIITLEGAELDRAGAEACIIGLFNRLSENTRFEEVKKIDKKFASVTLPGAFPPPVEWPVVESVCRENEVDLLFSLETFDTDTKINYQIIKRNNPKTIFGVITNVEHQANMQTLVKTAWRIYYPAGQMIIDEFPMVHNLNFSATGLTPVAAAAALINRKEAVKRVAEQAGEIYASRIIPYEITVTRDYYVKGTNNFKIAMRKARTGNWDEAGELWKIETENPKRKIAARACYNMAIIAEIKGNLDVALEWAQKAYEDYNLRKALEYVRILENRMNRNQLLELQEEGI
ncbi:MAG TPA: DUF6340 family protein, partial [Bacteroidales bacterium]|nr:DUF6340 family protein [Bacteroidales bacterium]